MHSSSQRAAAARVLLAAARAPPPLLDMAVSETADQPVRRDRSLTVSSTASGAAAAAPADGPEALLQRVCAALARGTAEAEALETELREQVGQAQWNRPAGARTACARCAPTHFAFSLEIRPPGARALGASRASSQRRTSAGRISRG